jgi:hypothetical protein
MTIQELLEKSNFSAETKMRGKEIVDNDQLSDVDKMSQLQDLLLKEIESLSGDSTSVVDPNDPTVVAINEDYKKNITEAVESLEKDTALLLNSSE